jgi:O-antigen/teichoic acid export membrane protein
MLNRVLSYGVLKLIGMISSIVYVVYLGRLLTPDKLGVYYLVVTFLSLFSLLARLGFDNYLVKRISILSHNKAGSQINSLVRDVSIIILKSSFLLMIVFGISTPILDKYFFDDSGVEIYLLISIAPLYLYSMVFIFSEVFKSLDEYKTSVLFPSVIYPSSSLFFVWVSYDYMGDLALYFGICFGSLISYALAYKLLKRKICLDKHEKDKVAIPFQKNFFLISLSNYIFASVDTLFLGLLSTNADVGVFSILLRLALPFSILLIVINNVFSRKFSILNDGGKAQESYNLY